MRVPHRWGPAMDGPQLPGKSASIAGTDTQPHAAHGAAGRSGWASRGSRLGSPEADLMRDDVTNSDGDGPDVSLAAPLLRRQDLLL